MKKHNIIIVEEKRSALKTAMTVVTAIATVMVAIVVVYKFIENKLMPKIIDRVDVDGDGLTDAIMLDTTGNGEIDTIVLTGSEEEEKDNA